MADEPTCPLRYDQVVERYFLEHRAKLLDIAAFLDRLERAVPTVTRDPRVEGLKAGLRLLAAEAQGGTRAQRLLELWSDVSTEPLAEAPGKGADGVDMARDYAQLGGDV